MRSDSVTFAHVVSVSLFVCPTISAYVFFIQFVFAQIDGFYAVG